MLNLTDGLFILVFFNDEMNTTVLTYFYTILSLAKVSGCYFYLKAYNHLKSDTYRQTFVIQLLLTYTSINSIFLSQA